MKQNRKWKIPQTGLERPRTSARMKNYKNKNGKLKVKL